MNKSAAKVGMAAGIFLGFATVAFAITNCFFTRSEKSDFTKKQIFEFEMSTGLNSEIIGPGDSFSVSPSIVNDATEDMYVFVEIQMPTIYDGTLYEFDIDEDWYRVREDNGTSVYAYGYSEEMMVLCPGDSTSVLTNQMTMKTISNAEYAAIDDINITITGYAIGTEGVSMNPVEAWSECKMIGNIE